MSAYAEFAVATNFSFLRGASHPEELVNRAKELGLAGLGIADRNSVAGVVRAHEAAKETGLKFAPGARLVFADGTPDILAFPQDRAAWGRLTKLLTLGKRRAEKGHCLLYCDDLLAHIAGLNLIVLPDTAEHGPAAPSPHAGRAIAYGKALLPPLPACGVKGILHKLRLAGKPPHPDRANARSDLSPQAGRGDSPHARRGDTAAIGISTQAERGAPRSGTCPPVPTNKFSASGANTTLRLLLILRDAAPRAVWLGASMRYRGDDARRLARIAAMAHEARIPVIAVGDVLYHAPERRRLQDIVTCVREHLTLVGAGRRLEANAERHLKAPHEMARLFRDAPEALVATLHFLERCTFSLDELRYEYPDETREGFATPQEALCAYTEEGARRRYPGGIPSKVRATLDHEYELVATLNYAPYFLTVHDIVRFARSRSILCQGRGSAANSAICFCLGITEVDPERADLLFERFISVERREPPDIDVDFEHERREEVIQYIYQRYGRDRAGLAATVICYRARSAIRDVGKAFGLTDDTLGALAGMLWGSTTQAVTAKDASRAGLDPADPHLAEVLALARELIGFPRHLSQHVGGFVITRGRLDEVIPIENAAMADRTCVEWDKDDLDALAILKIDVLALGMLTCLRRGFDLLNKHYGPRFVLPREAGEGDHAKRGGGGGSCNDRGGGSRASIRGVPPPPPCGRSPSPASLRCAGEDEAPFSLAAIPPEDPAVYRMLSRADSIGVFQVESRAQMSMLPRLKPRQFYDLVIEVAIVRPGPIQGDMVHPYLRRRLGVERVQYPSPAPAHGSADELERVLGKTLGVPLFQEQAMRIAIVAAGFTPAEADKLRRAMATFRRVGTISYFRDKLIEGMASRGYPRDFAARCFRQIEGFGEYGFPESHAASFALLVYASAWMKCRYPDAFAAALLNSQPMGFYAPAQIVRDAIEHGVEVRPVDINHSCWDNTLEAQHWDNMLEPHRNMMEVSTSEPSGDCVGGEASSPSPRLRGEGRGEGHFPQAQTRGKAPSPGAPERADLSPQAGRGEESAASDVIALTASGGGMTDFGAPHGEGMLDLDARPGQMPRLHARHAGMADDIRGNHAVRLGFRQISGCREDDGLAIERCRGAGFDSIHDLWLRSALKPSALERLAAADAFRSLGLDRRQALWAVRALRRAGDKDDLPLFAIAASAALEPEVALPPMRIGEQVVEDYRHLHLSLKAHPVSFLRSELDRRGILRHDRLAAMPSGRRVTVAGLVLVRQRPGSANGVIFMTLEDETAIANTIVWPKIFETFRPVVLGARLVSVTGRLQNEFGVIHVVAERLDDLSVLLRCLAENAGCVEALAKADQVKHSGPDWQPPPRRPAPEADITPAPNSEHAPAVPAARVRSVMPKGRNFR